MAKTVDELIVEIKADTKDLNAKLRNIEGTLGRTSQAGRGAFVPMIASVGRLLPLLGAVAAGLASIAAVQGIARVGSEFEDMRDSLNQVFGSVQRGNTAFSDILTFAQTTPFQIEDVTRAFISLKGAGIEPNLGMLQTFADTASTSIDQLGAFNAMVRLVQRSAAGGLGLEEINQLDDRGIPATKILTDALGVTRLELSKFGQTAEGAAMMVQLLIDGMQEQFGGAMVNKMDNLSTKTSNMTIAFKELQNSVFEGGLGDLLKDLADRLGELALRTAAFVRLVTGTQSVQDVTGVGPDDPTGQKNALESLILEEQAILEKLSQASSRSAARHGNVGKVSTSQERLDMLKRMKTEIELTIDLQKKLELQQNDTAGSTNDFAEAMGELDTVILEAAQNLSRDFADALLEGKDLLASFSDFTKSIVSEIIATFIRLQVVEPILKGIFPGLGTGTDTIGRGAGGGRATHGRPMLVGERGPELFVPHSAGSIMNNADTRSAMGGGGISVVQNISFSTGVVPTVKAEITKMLPQIADVSKAAVLEANLRGGSFRRGMR
jgi:tape measure domain-containing protein